MLGSWFPRRCSTKHQGVLQNSECAMQRLKEWSDKLVTPDEVPGVLKYEKIKAPAKKSIRLTQVYGSFEGSGILELCEIAETERIEKRKKVSTKRSRWKKTFLGEQWRHEWLRSSDIICGQTFIEQFSRNEIW